MLKYGKLAAKIILAQCYYQDSLALERKRKLAMACIATTVGWSKSHTIKDSSRLEGWQYVHVFVHKRMTRILGTDDDPTTGLVAEPLANYWMPGWRKGILGKLKISCPKGRVGSNPTPGISDG